MLRLTVYNHGYVVNIQDGDSVHRCLTDVSTAALYYGGVDVGMFHEMSYMVAMTSGMPIERSKGNIRITVRELEQDEIKVGDMAVVNRTKDVCLVSHVNYHRGLRFGVQFTNNGTVLWYDGRELLRATMDEIEASWLNGVGCNQSSDHRK